MSQARQLAQLQALDTRLDQTAERLAEIEAALNDNSAVRKAKARAVKAAEGLTSARLALKRAEQDVEAQQQKIERNQKALYGGGKTVKELEDLQMESGALARHLDTLEEVQIEAMIAFEVAEGADRAAQDNLEQVKAQAAADNTDLTSERQSLTANQAELQADREKAAAPIAADVLEIYEKLRRTRKGLAVTTMKDGGCAACGATLSAAQAQAARSPNSLTNCEVCGRIIHV